MPRLPSALKWLIDRRGRVDGEIKKIEYSLAKCRRYSEDLAKLQELLSSIDKTISLHEIQLKAELIPTIRSNTVLVNLRYGELTREIMRCLKESQAQPVRMSSIASFIAENHPELGVDGPLAFKKLKLSVSYRLKLLAKDGFVVRYHNPISNHEGIWGLPKSPSEQP